MKYNYYHYKSETFTCSKCNWTGQGSETFLSDLSEIHALRDVECPKCEQTLYTFNLSAIGEEQKELGNPEPFEKVCFNCTNMLWMVGIGQGLKCRLTMSNIENRRHTCEKFEFKNDKL